MLDKGIGLFPLGLFPLGYGQSGSTTSVTSKLFIKSDGSQGNVAKIDSLTGDYVLDDHGNAIGDNSLNQMVYLGLKTTINTSCLLNFGLDIENIKTISPNIQLKFKLAVNSAVKHLIDRKLISIVSIDVINIQNKPGAIQVFVNYKDLTTNETNKIKLLG
jgi:hypothetical protein